MLVVQCEVSQSAAIRMDGQRSIYMRKQFITYYTAVVKQQIDRGIQLEDINVDFRFTVLKEEH